MTEASGTARLVECPAARVYVFDGAAAAATDADTVPAVELCHEEPVPSAVV